MTPEVLNDVICFLKEQMAEEKDQVQYARIGEAIFLLQDQKAKIEGRITRENC